MSFKRTLAPLALAFAVAAAPMQASAHNIPNLPDMVDKLMPSVAFIGAAKDEAPPAPVDPANPAAPTPGEQEKGQSFGSGSGFVYEAQKGYVITNNHVIDEADEIMVVINDYEYPATLVGTDPYTDIAVVQITPDAKRPLTAVTLGDSDKLRIGEDVIAIGSPHGLVNTVTTGIISQKNRQMRGPYDQLLQTDASINPGNSGGPLFGATGDLVGMNTAIISRSGGSAGLGFSIPVNQIKFVADTLIKNGKIEWGFLGAGITAVNSEIEKDMNLSSQDGILIQKVEPGMAAEKGGLQKGDVVYKVNGEAMNDTQDFIVTIGKILAGNTAQITILRQGEEMQLDVVLGARPPVPKNAAPEEEAPEKDSPAPVLPAPAP